MVHNWTEDFYNLKKLAEVTLAGGYMQSETQNQHETFHFPRNEAACLINKTIHVSIEKIGKYCWDPNSSNVVNTGQISYIVSDNDANETSLITGHIEDSIQKNATSSITYDDQMFSYSHKLFDKRKSRSILVNSHLSTNEIHSCAVCGKNYSTSSNLARHRQTHRYVYAKENLLK
jgi:hypothetical protein